MGNLPPKGGKAPIAEPTQYVRVVSCIMDEIHLEILLNALLKELKNVFAAHCDLVIGTIPHRLYGNGQPAEWVVVMRWDGVGV